MGGWVGTLERDVILPRLVEPDREYRKPKPKVKTVTPSGFGRTISPLIFLAKKSTDPDNFNSSPIRTKLFVVIDAAACGASASASAKNLSFYAPFLLIK